jgi:hypothetical protein
MWFVPDHTNQVPSLMQSQRQGGAILPGRFQTGVDLLDPVLANPAVYRGEPFGIHVERALRQFLLTQQSHVERGSGRGHHRQQLPADQGSCSLATLR